MLPAMVVLQVYCRLLFNTKIMLGKVNLESENFLVNPAAVIGIKNSGI